MRATRIFFLALLSGCAGPPAPDAALCADYVQRLCAAPVCEAVTRELGALTDCEAALLANTGCADPAFAFTSPSRTRLLECRTPLLREGDQAGQHPACEDVGESLAACPDVVRFLSGEAP